MVTNNKNMTVHVNQIYTGCLAHGAYYIESNGEAAIIDPLREIQPYLDLAKERKARITYIFETHFHADFVSGHVDLAKKTGAPIIYGPTAMKTGFDSISANDGQEFKLGLATIRLIHTPGHTLESSCFLLLDEKGKETALFTGDTLFIGDVGRPDLAQHVIKDLTPEKLAAHLYNSLRNKIMILPDEVIIYPAHGSGSACGKNISKETFDTLGHQKKTNYALRVGLSKETFIKELLDGLTQPPDYFPKNVLMNIQGYDSFEEVMERGNHRLSIQEFNSLSEIPGNLILDTRSSEEFSKGFIPGSINIGIDGNFAVWVGTLIKDIRQPILLVTEPGREKEVIIRLARVGYDHALGYLEGGIQSWKNAMYPMETIPSITAEEFGYAEVENPRLKILDVRKKSEYDSEHIVNALNAPLDYIQDNKKIIDTNKTYYIHCAGGYRSMSYASILKKEGYHNLINVHGGFSAIKENNTFKITNYVCPSTML